MHYRVPSPRNTSRWQRVCSILAIALCVIAPLTACATPPSVSHVAAGPIGSAQEAVSFVMAPVENEVSRAAATLVEQELEKLGYVRSVSPDYLVEVSIRHHAAATGAFTLSTEAGKDRTWIDQPERKYDNTKKIAQILRVRFLIPGTDTAVLTSDARIVSSDTSIAGSIGKMVEALFATTPLPKPTSVSAAAKSD